MDSFFRERLNSYSERLDENYEVHKCAGDKDKQIELLKFMIHFQRWRGANAQRVWRLIEHAKETQKERDLCALGFFVAISKI